MFGSNFMANFGIPDFPFQGTDAQGGMFAPNAAIPGQDPSQNAAPAIGQPTANPVASPAQPPAPNPLAGGPLSPGGAPPTQPPAPDGGMMAPPPAAGIGSPFGKPQV